MNIAIFTNNYLPNPFGVTGSIESFRKQFEKQGHTVYIFAPQSNYKDTNPNVFRYPSVDLNYKISFPLPIPFSFRNEKIIKNLKIDIIHSQHPNLLGTVAKKWAKKKNIPLVFTWHTLYDQYVHFAPLIPKKLASHWIIYKAVNYADSCDQVITPTECIKNIVTNWGVKNKNIISIPTGIEEEFYQKANGNLVREKYNIKPGETVLLLVSRLTQEKNLTFLFQSIFKVLKNNSKIKFLVVGEGALKNELESLAQKENFKNQIIFSGLASKEEIKNYYAASDIFVYASKSETQGMIVSEAMYMGLPIVALDAPGICDLVKNNENGFLVSENENEFALATEKLINDPELRNKFSAESKKIAQENFTDKICAEKMLKVYQSLIRKNDSQ